MTSKLMMSKLMSPRFMWPKLVFKNFTNYKYTKDGDIKNAENAKTAQTDSSLKNNFSDLAHVKEKAKEKAEEKAEEKAMVKQEYKIDGQVEVAEMRAIDSGFKIAQLENLKDKYIALSLTNFKFSSNADFAKDFAKDFLGYSKNVVFSRGNCDARLMIIGEAPGEEEDKLLKPFVGRSGKLLSEMLKKIGYDDSNSYVANVIPFRPPDNRTPTASEIALMKPLLLEHIKIIDPLMILAVGAIASKTLEISEGISKAQGHLITNQIGNIFCIYHPSYILRLQSKKKEFWLSLLQMDAEFVKLSK